MAVERKLPLEKVKTQNMATRVVVTMAAPHLRIIARSPADKGNKIDTIN